MSQNYMLASNFYKVARGKKPATRMMMHSVGVLAVLLVWALLTPISETAVQTVKVVSKSAINGDATESMNPSATVQGKVIDVVARENQWVKKGELLARLDSQEYTIERQGELEKIESMEAEIRAKQKQIELAIATHQAKQQELATQLVAEKALESKTLREQKIKIERASVELERARAELKRARKLQGQRAISESEFDSFNSDCKKAREDLALAELPPVNSNVEEIESRIKSAAAAHEERIHEIACQKLSLENRVAESRNEIRALDLSIKRCEIVAPSTGQISSCNLRIGDLIVPGPIDITISQEGLVAESLMPSGLIGNVKNGDRAIVMLDGIDWLIDGTLDAKVSSVSSDPCQEEVALGDGSHSVVDGYRVWFEFESNEKFKRWDSVRFGMTGTVQIETGKKTLAIYLIEKAIGNELFSASQPN